MERCHRDDSCPGIARQVYINAISLQISPRTLKVAIECSASRYLVNTVNFILALKAGIWKLSV